MFCCLNKQSKKYKTLFHFIEIFKKKYTLNLNIIICPKKSVNVGYNISQRSHFNTYLCRFV